LALHEEQSMKRMSISAEVVICALYGLLGSLSTMGCEVAGAERETPTGAGAFRVPLTTEVDGKTYRLTNLSIRVAGASELWLYGSDDPSETALVANLTAGSYTSDLESYALERAGRDGVFHPVIAELVSSPHHEFRLLNGTTTTIGYRFETDGQIVDVGSGALRVEVEVASRPGACTPLGNDCGPGTWCAPSELTGEPLACVPAGSASLAEPCGSPLDCAANSSCFDFGAGDPVCAALCSSEAFGEPCDAGGTCQPQGADYGVCAPEGGSTAQCPLSRKLWPTSGVMDAVFDATRCRIYATTTTGEIVSHHLADDFSETLVGFGTALRGLDLSPDGGRLVAADSGTSVVDGQASNRIHVLDLDGGVLNEFAFPLAFYESGTYMPVFVDDHTVFVTSTFNGSGWVPLRRVDLSDGSVTVIREVQQNTMLSTTADRRRVAYAEANISSGDFGILSVDGGDNLASWSNAFLHTIAVSHDASQVALPYYGGLAVYDGGLSRLATLSRPGSYEALGAVYSPDSDVLYVAWGGDASIEALDSATLEPLFTIDENPGFGYRSGFGPGRLRISPDGRLLLAVVDGGVMAYPVQFN
jgi:hypothetical protein